MRDYRHSLMGQNKGPSPLNADRSTPQRAQLWRRYDGVLHEIVAIGEYAYLEQDDSAVVFRVYEPNGKVMVMDLSDFMAEFEPGSFRFVREY
jgi:hypothetical protein